MVALSVSYYNRICIVDSDPWYCGNASLVNANQGLGISVIVIGGDVYCCGSCWWWCLLFWQFGISVGVGVPLFNDSFEFGVGLDASYFY